MKKITILMLAFLAASCIEKSDVRPGSPVDVDIDHYQMAGTYDVPVKEGCITVVKAYGVTLAEAESPMTIWVPRMTLTRSDEGLTTPSTVSNKLRLLRLPEEVREKIIAAELTERHARALLRIENELHAAADTVIKRSLNVAQTERLVNAILEDETAQKPRVIKLFKDVRIFVNTINHAVDTMREAGIKAEALRTETQDSIEFTVRIPKEFACQSAG